MEEQKEGQDWYPTEMHLYGQAVVKTLKCHMLIDEELLPQMLPIPPPCRLPREFKPPTGESVGPASAPWQASVHLA